MAIKHLRLCGDYIIIKFDRDRAYIDYVSCYYASNQVPIVMVETDWMGVTPPTSVFFPYFKLTGFQNSRNNLKTTVL